MTKLIDIIVPEGQQEGTESTLTSWLIKVGDEIARHQPLIEIETDKVVVEVAAPAGGVLAEILVEAGEQVEPGDILGRIAPTASDKRATPAGSVSQPAPLPSKPDVSDGLSMSPAVRRLLKRHDIDATAIRGSGRGGRITHADAKALIAERTGASPAAKPVEATITGRLKPHNAMRQKIARHMAQSMQIAPHVTSVFDIDMRAVIDHRANHRAAIEAGGASLTLTAYFVRAAAAALQAVPEVNSRFHDDGLELFEDINIGIGTALGDEGLIVPVIRRVQDLDLTGIALRLHDLTERARGGRLEPADVAGGTFTISNHGVSGSLMATPIVINQPQIAILGIGKLEDRAVVANVDGKKQLEIRPRCYVTLTIDHRALDAFQTNRFLTAFKQMIESEDQSA